MKNNLFRLVGILLTVAILTGSTAVISADDRKTGYRDVSAESWYSDAVAFVTSQGLMNGVGGGMFSPNDTMTRAEAVTVIYRLAGKPEAQEDTLTFADVMKGSYYEAAIRWAAANEIAKGTSETEFGPHKPVTREQFACFLIRYAQFAEAPCVTDEWYPMVEQAFHDGAAISGWAKNAMALMTGLQLYRGNENEYVQPQKSITRAEASTVLMRYM